MIKVKPDAIRKSVFIKTETIKNSEYEVFSYTGIDSSALPFYGLLKNSNSPTTKDEINIIMVKLK
jgi:hypothetical protein